MKFFFSDHFIFQRREQRKISKKLSQTVYLQFESRYFDTFINHHVAVARMKHMGKLKIIMVAYDIIDNDVLIITAYPLKEQEIVNRVKRGRWVLKNEED